MIPLTNASAEIASRAIPTIQKRIKELSSEYLAMKQYCKNGSNPLQEIAKGSMLTIVDTLEGYHYLLAKALSTQRQLKDPDLVIKSLQHASARPLRLLKEDSNHLSTMGVVLQGSKVVTTNYDAGVYTLDKPGENKDFFAQAETGLEALQKTLSRVPQFQKSGTAQWVKH